MKISNSHSIVVMILLTALIISVSAPDIRAQNENQLPSVIIGQQEWMLANLNVDHFRNGDPVPEAKTAEEWKLAGENKSPAWCYYNNDPQNGLKYGRLYNWYAVIDPRGLAPEGWHIPSSDEWNQLAEKYGGRRVAGKQLKSTTDWACDGNGNNDSGFTGLPGGIRSDKGEFDYQGQYGYWWSTSEYNSYYAYYRYLYNFSKNLFGYINYFKESGFSVRCIRDELSKRELALQPPMIFINPDEAQYSGNRRLFQGIPGIERSSGGRLWVSRFSGSTGEGAPGNYALLITSGDDGKTWSDLKLVVDMPDSRIRICDPCLWIDPLGRLWFFWCQAYYEEIPNAWMHCGVWAMMADNPDLADPVWSEPRRLCEGVMLNKPTVLTNGDWLFPVNLKKHLSGFTGDYKTETGEWMKASDVPSSIAVMTSKQGKDFSLRGAPQIIDSADYTNTSEPMIAELRDGTLWMLIRMRYGMGESVSKDGGRTWSPIVPSSIKHTGSRFFLRRLNSGNLLLVKHGRIDERTSRELLTAFISGDDGATWDGGLMLDERYHLSYPDGFQTPDGDIYVVYDHGRYPGPPREILMAVFTEANVLKGKPSGKTRQKVLINKALEPLCDQQIIKEQELNPSGFVTISNHEWMAGNLDVNHFRNGDPIPEAKTEKQWKLAGKEKRPAWCHYGNDPGNDKKYGKLYNWYAVSDPRGLAPEGCHLPDEKEWSLLAENLGGARGAGNKLKSEIGWACGGNGTNESGFKGHPGGIRLEDGTYHYSGEYGFWWSTTELRTDYAHYHYLYCHSDKLFRYTNYVKASGFSVRCLRDQ